MSDSDGRLPPVVSREEWHEVRIKLDQARMVKSSDVTHLRYYPSNVR